MTDFNVDPYWDDFDPEKKYYRILAVPGRIEQAREFTQLQTMLQHQITQLSSVQYHNGQVLSGCLLNINEEKTIATISSGKIYADGLVAEFVEPASLTITGIGTEIIGILKREDIITELEDASLKDPATGYNNYDAPGSHRLKIEWEWAVLAGTGYGVFTLLNGEVPSEGDSNPLPKKETENVLDIIARRDYLKSGNYVLNGLVLSLVEHPTDPQNYKQLVVGAGTARILGYDITLNADYKMDMPVARDTASILNEPWTFDPYHLDTDSGGEVKLGERPVSSITGVTATVIAVDGLGDRPLVTRGQIPGGSDELSEESVVEILAINQGGTWDPANERFNGGVNFPPVTYARDGNNVDWSLSGDEPAPGSSYSVAYKYRRQLVKELVAATQAVNEHLTHGDDSGDDQLAHAWVCETNNFTGFTFFANDPVGGQAPDPSVAGFRTKYIRDVDFTISKFGKIEWYDYDIQLLSVIKGTTNSVDNLIGFINGYSMGTVLDVAYYDNPADLSFNEETSQFEGATAAYVSPDSYTWSVGNPQINWSATGAEPAEGDTYYVAVLARKHKTTNHPGFGASYYTNYKYWETSVRGDYICRDSFYKTWISLGHTSNRLLHYGLDLESFINFWRTYNYRTNPYNTNKPYPGTMVEIDYRYYLPRYVLVFFNADDPVALTFGISSRRPTEPVVDTKDKAILLASIYCPADSLDMLLRNRGVVTFKVHDLHDMRDRVIRTEQNLASTWLDMDAKSLPVSNKKGITTTAFHDNERIDSGWPLTAYSIDPDWEELALPHEDGFYTAELNAASSTCEVYANICTMKPNATESVEQSFYTGHESIAPYALANQDTLQSGQSAYMKIKPAGDTVIIPRVINLGEGSSATSTQNLASGGRPRLGHIGVEYSGKMYVWGGTTGPGQANYTNTMDIYDTSSNTWVQGSAGGTPRIAACGVVYNNKWYIWGGFVAAQSLNAGGVTSNTMDIYDFATGSWSTGISGGTSRVAATAVVINNKMYIHSGWNYELGTTGSSAGCLNTLDIFDFTTLSWSTGAAGGPTKYCGAASTYNNKMYCWGGGDGYTTYNRVDVYDPATNTWTQGTQGGTPRFHISMQQSSGKIYIYGGYTGNATTHAVSDLLEIYDIGTGAWTEGPGADRHIGFSSSVLYSNRIYIWGGGIFNYAGNWMLPTEESIVVFIYNITSGQWEFNTVVNNPTAATSLDDITAWINSDLAKLSNPTRWFSKGWTGGTEKRTTGAGATVDAPSTSQKEIWTTSYMRDVQGVCRQLRVDFNIPGGLISTESAELDFFLYFGNTQVSPTLTNNTPPGAAAGTFRPRPLDNGASGWFMIPPNVPEGRIEVKATSNPMLINGKEWRQTVVAVFDAAVVEQLTVQFEKCRCNCWCHCNCNCWNCRGRCGTGPLAETLEPVGKLRVLKEIEVDFYSVHPDYGVYGCIVNTENGQPTSNTISTGMIARQFRTAEQMVGAGMQTFTFDDPVFFKDAAYAIVITGEDGFNINSLTEIAAGHDIRCKIATLGKTDSLTGMVVGSQPFKNGILWRSLTGVTWEQDQTADLKFKAIFNLYPTNVDHLVYMKEVTVDQATAFICNWNSSVPEGTFVTFEYRTQSGDWTEFSPFSLTYLTEVATSLFFRARMKTSAPNITPQVAQFAGLYVQSTQTALKVVTKSFDVDLSDVADIWLDSHLPSGAVQQVRITFDNGVSWVTLGSPVDGHPSGNLVEYTSVDLNAATVKYRYHWRVTLTPPNTYTKVRVEVSCNMTGGENARLRNPRFSRLIVIASTS
jgi:hypothetical protein